MALWLAQLSGRTWPIPVAPLRLAVPSTWAHVLLMFYTLYVFFIRGFLFAVFRPRADRRPG